jgi:aldose sugar dehydrogenase
MKKQRFFTATLLLVALMAIAGLLSFQGDSDKQQKANPEEAAYNYQKFCAGCHGDKLEKFAAKKWMEEKGNESVVRSISEGIEASGMPSFRKSFTDAQMEALASYVKRGIPADKSMLRPAVTPGGIMESEVQRFIVDTVVSGLDVPWGLVFLPGGDLLITERAGKLYRFSGGKLSAPLEGLPPLMATGQGGLLDICLHPDYEKNGWIYFSYSAPDAASSKLIGNTVIMRARLNDNRLVDQQVLFSASPATDRGHHFGCKLAFDGKGYLFFGVGDRGQHFDFPQKLDNHNGKIHRIRDDGTIPADNPFVHVPDAMPSIYSYGHRNPQGTCLNPLTGDVWETEHGPRGGDEINVIKPGLNYGWPVISYGINYDGTVLTGLTEKAGMEQPIHYWTPSIAPCGMTFLTGTRYPGWQNNLLVGSLRFKYLERLVIRNNSVIHQEKLLEGIGRVRNVVISPDGTIYVAIETPGKIVRLVPVEAP